MNLIYNELRPTISFLMSLLLAGYHLPVSGEPTPEPDQRRWLAGDHHIHSRYSVGWNKETDPPTPQLGGEGIYPIPMNALMAKFYGLSWMVQTDHGGPNHSKINAEWAYPELQLSREAVPELIQFYGMELNTPAADHSSLIIPYSEKELEHLYRLESGFDRYEAYPPQPARNTEAKMLEALEAMRDLRPEPIVIANHPSRSAEAPGKYGLDEPAELRGWNDTAPHIAVGMAGAPGHQAAALKRDGSLRAEAPRGGYRAFPTMGGFDQMTARLGGFWDSMLGEGRHWWITANSDSHVNWFDGGYDFWPGEYSKTWVLAKKNHDDILAALRAGHVFVSTGDLIDELYVTASPTGNADKRAGIGDELALGAGDDLSVTIRFHDPDTDNANGDNPAVARVDLIAGKVSGKLSNPTVDTNPDTHVVKRFTSSDWTRDSEYRAAIFTMKNIGTDHYIRVRGTNTEELEPEKDPPGEDPWQDLWFYSNPVFIDVD